MLKTMPTPRNLVAALRRPANPKPSLIQYFMVQGINFRCVSYRDLHGRWRDAFNQAELFGDIRILE